MRLNVLTQGLGEGSRYAGIGSRKTPEVVQRVMTQIARHLAERGFILRSGGAHGADTAFEVGAGPGKEIFLPHPGFNGNPSPRFDDDPEALYYAARHHPKWDSLSDDTRQLMRRNAQIILGQDTLAPVAFVVCWTADAADGTEIPTTAETGGTGHGIRIAAEFGIPILNLRRYESDHA